MDTLRSVKQLLLERLQTINAILEEERQMSKTVREDSREIYVPYRVAVLGSKAVHSVGLLEPSAEEGVGRALEQASMQLNDIEYVDPAQPYRKYQI